MELGGATRPRAPVEPFQDYEPRAKCTLCCGLRCGLFTGTALFAFSSLCNAIVLGKKLTNGQGVYGFLNRNLFLAVPVAAITATHQTILSEYLWSKQKKTVLEINFQSALMNIALWCVGVGLCTVLSRKMLPSRSRTYRLNLWEYQRSRRGCANPWLPSAFGRLTDDLDWYNLLWTLSLYHVLWGMISVTLEKESGAHYALLFKDWQYSKWCSPRWREWRELEIQRTVSTEQGIVQSRWGTFLTNDKWRTRNF